MKIKIDLQQTVSTAKSGSTNKRRLVPLILGALLIAGFAAVFLWWQYYKTTPAYSLALLVDAAQRNDAAVLDRIIDMDKVVDNFVPEVVQKATGGYASNFASLLRGQLQSLAPGVMATVKQIIREEIQQQISELAARSGAKPFLLTALAMPYVVSISDNGDTAKATFSTKDHQVELFMQRYEDGLWRVVSLRDDTLAARIFDNVVKHLPEPGLQLAPGIRKQFKAPGKMPALPLFSDK